MSPKKKVLLVQTTLQPPGGGNTVAAWIIEALKEECSVSLLTWKPPDFEEINRFYGTSLNDSELRVHSVSPVLRPSLTRIGPGVKLRNFTELMQ